MFPSPLGSVLTISQSASSQGLARWQGHSANPAWTPPSCQAVWGVHPCGRCNLQMNPRKTSRLKTSGRRTYVIWYHMIIWCMIYVRICVRMTVIAKSQKSCSVISSVNRMINPFNGIDIEQTYPWACLYKNPELQHAFCVLNGYPSNKRPIKTSNTYRFRKGTYSIDMHVSIPKASLTVAVRTLRKL